MKTFNTTIFVPSKFKKEMNIMESTAMAMKLNRSLFTSNKGLGIGALDHLLEEETFILVVNGEHEKYEIKLRVLQKNCSKTKLMVVEPESPEVKRFNEWRVEQSKTMSQNKGQKLQLKNFSVEDLRRLIRHAHTNQESSFVNYR